MRRISFLPARPPSLGRPFDQLTQHELRAELAYWREVQARAARNGDTGRVAARHALRCLDLICRRKASR